MDELEIPGKGTLQIEHLVCDVNSKQHLIDEQFGLQATRLQRTDLTDQGNHPVVQPLHHEKSSSLLVESEPGTWRSGFKSSSAINLPYLGVRY
jgi:hypothetical protein